MDSYTYVELLKTLKNKCENIAKIIKIDVLKEELERISEKESDENFWIDNKKVASLGKQKSKIIRILDMYNGALKSINDAYELYNLALNEEDEDMLNLLFSEATILESKIKKIEIEVMLNNKNDQLNAIITIQPGAGGTESQDWGSILYRMYLRWCERRGFSVELLDYQDGDEAGIKGVAFIIKGDNAYGYAKSESGVHRLVRISPFDANAKRHTSFASVQVSPEIDDDIDIVIEDKDIRVDTYRASGAGGQHINKTESAIRITHLPTGIVVQCQNDRSQHKNRATALKMLKSKLYDIELKKQNNIVSDKSEIGWGHQIRSYVLAPYRQVKDLRSNITYSNVDSILDGDLDSIIEGVLISDLSRD